MLGFFGPRQKQIAGWTAAIEGEAVARDRATLTARIAALPLEDVTGSGDAASAPESAAMSPAMSDAQRYRAAILRLVEEPARKPEPPRPATR